MSNALTYYLANMDDTRLDIIINSQHHQLTLLQQLRALPHRRAVFKALFKDNVVLVKMFVGDDAKRDSEREKAGINALQIIGSKTPALLNEAHLPQQQGIVLIIDYLENASSVHDMYLQADEAHKAQLLEKIVQLIAKQHEGGVYQSDIHLSNFLWSDEMIYTIDGGGINAKSIHQPLPQSLAIKNLSLFFAQLHPADDVLLPQLVERYNAIGHTQYCANDVLCLTQAFRQKRLATFLKKIYRNCSEFACTKTVDEFRVCRREMATPAFHAWLDNLDALLALTKKPAKMKHGPTSFVARLEWEGHSYIVKRYNIKGFWHALSRCCRPSRAWVSWRNGHLLRFLGITTPEPIALIEKRIGPFRGKAYLVTQAVDGLPLDKAIVDDRACIGLAATQIRRLADAQISHGDMKANNFMVSAHKVYLIDLDTMKQHHSAWFFHQAFRDDLQRFMRNWENEPTIRAAFENELQQLM